MFTIGYRNIFVVVVVVAGLAAAYWVSQAVAANEPIEGGGDLARSGSQGVSGSLEVPEVSEKERNKKPASRSMTASYYGYALAGLPTASGEPFDPEEHTAAHKSLPLGTELLVKRNGESVRVTVNDRGPYVAGRELDLSQGAAEEIGLTGPGEDEVKVTLL